jgi:hypothetical protein
VSTPEELSIHSLALNKKVYWIAKMKLTFQESYDLSHTTADTDSEFGIVIEYLIDEGFVDTEEEAKRFICCVSPELYEGIYLEAKEQNAGKIGAMNRKAVGRRAVGMGGAGFHGSVHGLGKDKKEKNNPSADDRRAAKQKAQAKKDRNLSRGISPSARRERARQNKEKSAYDKLDGLLKDVRGNS